MIPELNEPHPPQGGGAPGPMKLAWTFDDWWFARVRTELRKMNRSVPRQSRPFVARELHKQLDHLVSVAEKEWRGR